MKHEDVYLHAHTTASEARVELCRQVPSATTPPPIEPLQRYPRRGVHRSLAVATPSDRETALEATERQLSRRPKVPIRFLGLKK